MRCQKMHGAGNSFVVMALPEAERTGEDPKILTLKLTVQVLRQDKGIARTVHFGIAHYFFASARSFFCSQSLPSLKRETMKEAT